MEFSILLRKEKGWEKWGGREFNFPLCWRDKSSSAFVQDVQLGRSKYSSTGTDRCFHLCRKGHIRLRRVKTLHWIDFIISTTQIFLWFTKPSVLHYTEHAEYSLSAVTFQGTENSCHKSWYLPMGPRPALRTSYDRAWDQCNFLEPFLFHYSFLYWMMVLPRAMHLFRQSSKTKFYTNPDAKCFQGFYHCCTFLKLYVPQGLLYERCSNLNCSKIHYSYAFPDFIYHTYIFRGKK